MEYNHRRVVSEMACILCIMLIVALVMLIKEQSKVVEVKEDVVEVTITETDHMNIKSQTNIVKFKIEGSDEEHIVNNSRLYKQCAGHEGEKAIFRITREQTKFGAKSDIWSIKVELVKLLGGDE